MQPGEEDPQHGAQTPTQREGAAAGLDDGASCCLQLALKVLMTAQSGFELQLNIWPLMVENTAIYSILCMYAVYHQDLIIVCSCIW